MIPENILALQRQDATLRSQSLELIDADTAMSDHLAAVEAAMKAIFDHVVDRPEYDGDELTLKGLGIRLFNDLAAGLGEGLAGYYQRAFDAVRDMLELQFLFDDFSEDRAKVTRWATAGRRDREKEFGPFHVRLRLDARYGHNQEKRREHYQRLSSHASHPSPEGFRMVAPNGLGVLGGFVHERTLRALLEEMARHGLGATVNFTCLLPARSKEEELAKAQFVSRAGKWLETYMSDAVAEVLPTEKEEQAAR